MSPLHPDSKCARYGLILLLTTSLAVAQTRRPRPIPKKTSVPTANSEQTSWPLETLKVEGNHNYTAAQILAITLKYEAEVDLATGASEVGLTPDEFRARISQSELLMKHVGALRESRQQLACPR